MEIVNYQEQPADSKIIAIFDVYLGEQWQTTYRRIKLIKGRGKAFLQLPSYCEESNGEKKWYPYTDMSKEKKASFDTKVFELLKGFLK